MQLGFVFAAYQFIDNLPATVRGAGFQIGESEIVSVVVIRRVQFVSCCEVRDGGF